MFTFQFISFLVFTLSSASSHRFEPFPTYHSRNTFIASHFKSNYIQLSTNPPYNCTVTKEITKNSSNIFTFSLANQAISFSALFLPYHDNLTKYFEEDLSLSPSTVNKLLLSLSILFEWKANLTSTFVKWMNNTQELDRLRLYMKRRLNNDLIIEALHNLPLGAYINQMSWSDENVNDYQITGTRSPYTNTLKVIYENIVQWSEVKLWSEGINHLNLFLSIYHYTSSNSVAVDNRIYLLPYASTCLNVTSGNKWIATLRGGDTPALEFKSSSSYNIGDVFDYSITDDLSNDNLLLNYGFVPRDNPEHKYTFIFSILDTKLLFYKYLQREGFDWTRTEFASDSDNNNMWNIKFGWGFAGLNQEWLRFLSLYVDYTNKEEEMKNHPDKELNVLYWYYSTIYKNIWEIKDKVNITRYVEEIGSLSREIDEYDDYVGMLNNGTIIEQFENWYVYNHWHEVLNKRNIHVFNMENYVLWNRNLDFVYEDIMRLGIGKIEERYDFKFS